MCNLFSSYCFYKKANSKRNQKEKEYNLACVSRQNEKYHRLHSHNGLSHTNHECFFHGVPHDDGDDHVPPNDHVHDDALYVSGYQNPVFLPLFFSI